MWISPSHSFAWDDDLPELTPSLIADYVEKNRPFLRSGQFIDLVTTFKPYAKNTRKVYGNLQDTLDLHNMNLSGFDLSRVDLHLADLNGANLSGANLSRSNLAHTNFEMANLTGVSFKRANLSKAILKKATLTGADFTGANLFEADLSNVQGIDDELLAQLIIRTRVFRHIPTR